jgi:cytochrome c peroxidase
VACHSGSTYSDESLHASATAIDATTGAPIPTKTPSLRRIALTAPYFRDASKATLTDVVKHYDAGGCKKADPLATGPVTCDPELSPLGLTTQESTDLVAFLQNL